MSIKCLRRHPGYFYVSCSPSKIPYVGFSPVRLQTGIRLRPSSMRVWVKHLACIHHPNINLYAAKVMTICSLMALYGQVGDYADKRSIHQDHLSPEALDSPQGYVVPMGHRLLWPHPRLSALSLPYFLRPANLCPTTKYGLVPRASPICSAYLFHRAILRTPAL